VRLTNGSAAKIVDYTYEPYGKASADTASTNAFQYTGRENDGTGLSYYRPRYHHPVLGSFVSEDPIGLAGGPNLYAYVNGNPVGGRDPLGLLNVVGQVGGTFTTGVGGEGYVGVYVTIPQYNGPDFDFGAYWSGGVSAGWNVGTGASGGFMRGDVNDIRGVTYNVNAGGTVAGGTAMFDDTGLVGVTVGPSSEIGFSASYARTGAWSASEFFGWLFDRYMPAWMCK